MECIGCHCQNPITEDHGYHCSVRFNNQNRGLTLQCYFFSIGGLYKILWLWNLVQNGDYSN